MKAHFCFVNYIIINFRIIKLFIFIVMKQKYIMKEIIIKLKIKIEEKKTKRKVRENIDLNPVYINII